MLLTWSKISKYIVLKIVCLCFCAQLVITQRTNRIGSSFPLPWNKTKNDFISKLKNTSRWNKPSDYKILGVNVGGWLVLEPWITPSIFDKYDPYAIDEWTLCEHLGKYFCQKELEEHWGSFFTIDDLWKIKEGGLNTIRIPVGYWILGDIKSDEPWVTGSEEHLDDAIGWARTVGLDVLIDLHCAPGSQNGFDNSGKRGEINWDDKVDGIYPNIDRTIDILESLSQKYLTDDYPNVIGIEYLNEPFVTIDLNVIKWDFYNRAYPRTTKGTHSTFISDAFRFWDWFGFMEYPDYENVYLDTHHYEVFDTYVLGFSEEEHINNVCVNVKNDLKNAPLWNVVGEWSLATTDCTKWLNGYGRGARWDQSYQSDTWFGTCEGRSDSSTFSPEYKEFLNKWAEYQMDAYEADSGWFFWTLKTEQSPQWDYLQGLEEGWIPKQSERKLTC